MATVRVPHKTRAQEREQSLVYLREILPPGATVTTVLRHVSGMGMTRWIDCYVLKDSEANCITWSIARVLGRRVNTRNHEGIEEHGAGMDMGFHIVHSLSYALYPNGYGCTGESCFSNDHANGDTDYTPHWHSAGGYAIRQRWL